MPNPPPTVTAIFPVPKCPSIAGRTQNKPQPKLLSAVTAVLPVSILVVLQQTQFSELRFGHFRICYRRSQPYIRSQSAPKWGHILGTQKWPIPNLLSAVTAVHPVSKCSKIGTHFGNSEMATSESVIGGHSRTSGLKVLQNRDTFWELRNGHFRICYRRSQAYIRSQSAPKRSAL